MRVESSQLQLSAQSWLVRRELELRTHAAVPAGGPPRRDSVAIPASILEAAQRQSLAETPAGGPRVAACGDSPAQTDDPRLELMLKIAEVLLGHKIKLFRAARGEAAPVAIPSRSAGAESTRPARVQFTRVQSEAQQMNFQAAGTVQIADGRQIDFQAALQLSRQYVQVVSGQQAQANTTDPLFLNFDGKGVRLFSEITAFDLNNDGQAEALPTAAPGSGLLVLDRNGDGVATNGTELFGPQSGNGFTDLARHDTDNNGWIDEADPVFGQLKVWIQDGPRPGAIYTLADLGVGAISTAGAITPFDLKGHANELLAQLRATGIYLMEDGRPGLTAQIDLAC